MFAFVTLAEQLVAQKLLRNLLQVYLPVAEQLVAHKARVAGQLLSNLLHTEGRLS